MTFSMIANWCKLGYRPSTQIDSRRVLTWWLGKINVSATTTFSLLPALKTTTSAMSSGVSGSQPLGTCQPNRRRRGQ